MSIFYTDEDRASGLAERELRTAAETGRFEFEGWRVAKDGRRFWANVVLQPVRSPAGGISGYVKIARDISAKRARDLELRTSALLIDAITDYEVIMLDTEGMIRSWNRGAERLKGYQADEIIGKHVSSSIPRRTNAPVWRSASSKPRPAPGASRRRAGG